MTEVRPGLQRKLRTAAGMLIAGLIIEALTLYWSNPTSFLVYVSFGGVLVVLGILLYLNAIVSES